MIRAKIIETMEPMKLEVKKKEIMINSMTKIITSIIGGISGMASGGMDRHNYNYSTQY